MRLKQLIDAIWANEVVPTEYVLKYQTLLTVYFEHILFYYPVTSKTCRVYDENSTDDIAEIYGESVYEDELPLACEYVYSKGNTK